MIERDAVVAPPMVAGGRHGSPPSAPGHDRACRRQLPGRACGHWKRAAHLARCFRRRFALSGVWTAAVVPIGQRFRGAELSSAYVAGGILYSIDSIAGPLLTGLLADSTSLAAVPFVIASFCAVYLAVALLRWRIPQPSAPAFTLS